MLRETEANRTTDKVERVCSPDQPEFHLNDSIGKKLVWKRPNPNNRVIKNLDRLMAIMGHSVVDYTKKVEKQVKQLKRF